MEDGIDLWQRAGGQLRVRGPRRAEILRDRQEDRSTEAVIPSLHDEAVLPSDPASIEGERVVDPLVHADDVDLGAVRAIISMAIGDQVEVGALHEAGAVRALAEPSIHGGSIGGDRLAASREKVSGPAGLTEDHIADGD